MPGKLRVITVALITIAALGLNAPAASAHSAATFYPTRWAAAVDHEYGFQTGYPTGAYRFRTTDGKNQWNNLGGTNEPDFFAYRPDANYGAVGTPCSNTGSAIFWRDLDTAYGTNVLGVTVRCSSGTRITRFSLGIDNDRTWYTGTGDAPSNQYDLYSVATHEFGHVTGFAGHFGEDTDLCPNNSSRHTMCPTIYIGTERQRTPNTHDIHTFTNAY